MINSIKEGNMDLHNQGDILHSFSSSYEKLFTSKDIGDSMENARVNVVSFILRN